MLDITVCLISSISESSRFKYPSYWEKMSENENLKLIEVQKGSQQWQRIEQRVHKILKVTIEKIEIVQNKNIFNYYQNSKSFIEKENGGNADEMQLFHGTRSTNPSTIYSSSKGFGHQYSSSGMWGAATYFAQNGKKKYNQIFFLKF